MNEDAVTSAAACAQCVKGERDNVLAWNLRKIEALMQLDRMLRRDGERRANQQ